MPARYVTAAGDVSAQGTAGGILMAVCGKPDQCGLSARILDIQEHDGHYRIVMSWWNFGWVSAVDATVYTVANRGAPDSVLVLIFRDTPGGAQIELVQANMPDYAVVIPNPDGSQDTDPLSAIVSSHWNTLCWDGGRRHHERSVRRHRSVSPRRPAVVPYRLEGIFGAIADPHRRAILDL